MSTSRRQHGPSGHRWLRFLAIPAVAAVAMGAAVSIPAAPAGASGILVLSTGAIAETSCAINASGGLCWGRNDTGQVGGGFTSPLGPSVPTAIVGLPGQVTGLTSGQNHTCALLASAQAFCWGWNVDGQLGTGSTSSTLTPTPVTGGLHFAQLSAGVYTTCGVTSAGTVYCWGLNSNGQIGDGTTTNRFAPRKVLGLETTAKQVAVGAGHTCVLLTTGAVECWGLNDHGQIGNNTTTDSVHPIIVPGLSGITAISVGGSHSCALLPPSSSSFIECWGSNVYGQIGDGSFTDRHVPTLVAGSANTIQVSAGNAHTCALAQTSSVIIRCWGNNGWEQLGIGTFGGNVPTPTQVFGLVGSLAGGSGPVAVSAYSDATCAAMSWGGEECWGENVWGNVGDGATRHPHSVPSPVIGLTAGTQVLTEGANLGCALTSALAPRCWGDVTGNGSFSTFTSAQPVTGLTGPTGAVDAGWSDGCALSATGGLQCWGINALGEVGDGTTNPRPAPVPVSGMGSGVSAVSGGTDFTCDVVGATPWCWGSNDEGQLGNNTTTDSSTPVKVAGLTSVAQLSAGDVHTCAALKSGIAACWGWNLVGQLGNGSNTTSKVPVAVKNLTGVVQVSAGTSFTCAVTKAQSVFCWGDNSAGELGNGTTTSSNVPVAVTGLSGNVQAVDAGAYHACALTTSGVVMCWGANSEGELGNGTTTASSTPVVVGGLPPTVQSISAGGAQSCALVGGGAAYCWGDNADGELGDGSTANSSVPVAVTGL